MEVKEYVEELERVYEGKKPFLIDEQRIMEWDELVRIFLEYDCEFYETIYEFIDCATDRNGNLKLIDEEK